MRGACYDTGGMSAKSCACSSARLDLCLPPSHYPHFPFTQHQTLHIQRTGTGSMAPSTSSSRSSNSSSSSSTTLALLLTTAACAATTAAAALLLYNKKHRQHQHQTSPRPLPPLHVHLDLKGVSVRESDLALFRSLLHPSISLTHGQEVDSRTQLLIANFPSKGEKEKEKGARDERKAEYKGSVIFMMIERCNDICLTTRLSLARSLLPSLRNTSPPPAHPSIPHLPLCRCPPLLSAVLFLLLPLPLPSQPPPQRSSDR